MVDISQRGHFLGWGFGLEWKGVMSGARLAGKVAIVTGGGSGIGASIARRFRAEGAEVVITGRRKGPLEVLSEEIGCLSLVCDVGDFQACQAVVEAALARFGRIDILVSNAGVLYEGSVLEQSDQAWHDSLETNITGVMNMAKAILPVMREQRQGSIVNVSSIAGMTGAGGVTAYVTSKTAIFGLSRSMAVDYGADGIRVNTLVPGWTDTPMSRGEMQALADVKQISRDAATALTVKPLPLKRMAAADEVAACALFLASDDASFVTGTALVVDGGGSAVDVGTLSFAEM